MKVVFRDIMPWLLVNSYISEGNEYGGTTLLQNDINCLPIDMI